MSTDLPKFPKGLRVTVSHDAKFINSSGELADSNSLARGKEGTIRDFYVRDGRPHYSVQIKENSSSAFNVLQDYVTPVRTDEVLVGELEKMRTTLKALGLGSYSVTDEVDRHIDTVKNRIEYRKVESAGRKLFEMIHPNREWDHILCTEQDSYIRAANALISEATGKEPV